MTVRQKVNETLSEKTWVPLGMLVAVVGTAILGTIQVVGAANDIKRIQQAEKVEREKFQTEVSYTLAGISQDLDLRTKSRWTSDMMGDFASDLEKKNRNLPLIVPSVREIKRNRE